MSPHAIILLDKYSELHLIYLSEENEVLSHHPFTSILDIS
jgi:hypothetical protein